MNTEDNQPSGLFSSIVSKTLDLSDVNIYDVYGKNITSYYVITKVEGELEYVYKLD